MAASYRWLPGATIALWMALAAAVSSCAAGSDASPLAGRVRGALEAGRRLATLRAHHSTGTVEMGGRAIGTVETSGVRAPRAMREAMDIEGVRQVVTLIGDEAWVEDANGSVRELSGEERNAAVVAHALLFHLYLDEAPGLDVEPGDHGFVLRPTGGGAERTLEIGADFLPSRFTQVMSGASVTTIFSDWRPVDGVRFPFVTRQSTGDPRFDLVVRTTAVSFPDSLPADAIPRPLPGPAGDFELTDPAAARSIAIELVGGLVIVPVRVNGVAARFLLDTGAGATVLGTSLCDRLALPSRGAMEARGAGGSETASFVDVERLELPGVAVRKQTVVTIPLEPFAEVIGLPLDGILGYDFLSRFAVEIDYAGRRLGLYPSGEYPPRDGARRTELRIEANVPRVEGRLDEKHRGSFVIDTGNSSPLLLHTPFVREQGLGAEADSGSRSVTGVGGAESMRETVVDSLEIAGAVFRDVPTLLASADEGAVALGEAIGNIGGALFEDTVLAFDYGAGALWVLEPATAASASAR